jgi:hypothetical protein
MPKGRHETRFVTRGLVIPCIMEYKETTLETGQNEWLGKCQEEAERYGRQTQHKLGGIEAGMCRKGHAG